MHESNNGLKSILQLNGYRGSLKVQIKGLKAYYIISTKE